MTLFNTADIKDMDIVSGVPGNLRFRIFMANGHYMTVSLNNKGEEQNVFHEKWLTAPDRARLYEKDERRARGA